MTDKQSKSRGIALMILAMMLLPFVDAVSKSLLDRHDAIQVTWARNVVHCLLVLPIVLRTSGIGALNAPNLGLQFVRGALMVLTTVLYVSALVWLPLATALALVFIFPCIATLLSVLFLGEQMTKARLVAVSGGMIGALMVVQPSGDFSLAGAVLALCAALCYAVYVLLTRKLAHTTSSPVLLFYTAVVGAVGLSLVVPFIWKPPAADAVLVMLSIGLLAGLVHWLIILAYRYAQASVVSPFAYTQIIGATMLGYLWFEDLPNALAVVGIMVIVSSGVLIAADERQK